MSRRNATFWSKVGETGVGEMGVGEQGPIRQNKPLTCKWCAVQLNSFLDEQLLSQHVW